MVAPLIVQEARATVRGSGKKLMDRRLLYFNVANVTAITSLYVLPDNLRLETRRRGALIVSLDIIRGYLSARRYDVIY